MTKMLESTRETESSQSTINDTNGAWDALYAMLRKAELLTNDRSSEESRITQTLPALTLSEAQDAKRTELYASDVKRTSNAGFAEYWLELTGGKSPGLWPPALEIVKEDGEYFLKTASGKEPVTKDYQRGCFLLKDGTIIRQKENMTSIASPSGVLLEITPDAIRAQMSSDSAKDLFQFTKNAEVSVDICTYSNSSVSLKTDSHLYSFDIDQRHGKVEMIKWDLKTGQKTVETVETVTETKNGFYFKDKCTFKDGTIVQLNIMKDGPAKISLSVPFAKDSEYRHNVWVECDKIVGGGYRLSTSTDATYEIAKNSNLPIVPYHFDLDQR